MLIWSDAEPIHSGNRLNQKCPLITNSYLENKSSTLFFKSDWILFFIGKIYYDKTLQENYTQNY